MESVFYIAVMLPMWASYIVKAYARTLLLAKDGVAQWFLNHMGLEPILTSLLTLPAIGGNTLSTSGLGRFLVFVYIWLPFMILPVGRLWNACRPRYCRPQPTLARVRARPFATSFCRWRSGYCRGLNIHLFPDAGRFHRSAAGGAAGLLHR